MTTTNSNDRLMRILQASPIQLEQIDQVLAGKVASAPPTDVATGPLLIGMGTAAALLGVSRPTLWRMIKAGRLTKVEILPGSHRLRRTDVEAIAGPGPCRTGDGAMRTDAGCQIPDAGADDQSVRRTSPDAEPSPVPVGHPLPFDGRGAAAPVRAALGKGKS